MSYTQAMLSITGKTLGRLFKNAEGFGFEHQSGAWEGGFSTQQDARDAFMEFHNEWFETNFG